MCGKRQRCSVYCTGQVISAAMDLSKLEGLSIDEKYEIEEYREMMKAFAAAAAEGDLDQVSGGPQTASNVSAAV